MGDGDGLCRLEGCEHVEDVHLAVEDKCLKRFLEILVDDEAVFRGEGRCNDRLAEERRGVRVMLVESHHLELLELCHRGRDEGLDGGAVGGAVEQGSGYVVLDGFGVSGEFDRYHFEESSDLYQYAILRRSRYSHAGELALTCHVYRLLGHFQWVVSWLP